MALITILYGLPFVEVVVRANGQSLQLNRVLLDSGSGATGFKTDELEKIGVRLQPGDIIEYLSGIGGQEPVVEKYVDGIELGELQVTSFVVQVGAMDYGFQMDGILGADFLLQTGAVVDFKCLKFARVRYVGTTCDKRGRGTAGAAEWPHSAASRGCQAGHLQTGSVDGSAD
jgi:hypothetical protein